MFCPTCGSVVRRLLILGTLLTITPPGPAAASRDRDVPATPDVGIVPGEEPVRFASGSASLAGTLFRPADRDGFPAVVILAGSDRSARGGARTAIARHFAAHGVAALVYDSPGTGESSGNALFQTGADRIAEALHAAHYLRSLEGILPAAVGILGGSEGANIALMAAAEDPGIAFVIPVSGSLGVSILDILRYSTEKKGYGEGLTAEEIAQATTFKEIAFVLLGGVELAEWSLIESRVQAWGDPWWTAFIGLARQPREGLSEDQKQSFRDSLAEVVIHFSPRRWFDIVDVGGAVQRLVSLDADTLFQLLESGRYSRDWERSLCFSAGDIRCPVLAIWGEEDSFLPPNQSAARLEKYLTDSNHPDYEVIVFPDASHFLTVPGSISEFTPGYLETLTDWIGRRFGPELGDGSPESR